LCGVGRRERGCSEGWPGGRSRQVYEFAKLVAIESIWTRAADLEGVVGRFISRASALPRPCRGGNQRRELCFDEADLRQRAADGKVVVIGGKKAGADGVMMPTLGRWRTSAAMQR